MSEIENTIQLTAAITPTDTQDTYAVTIEDYNRGGYRSVADEAERLAITDDRRKQGMLVKQLDDDTYWTLSGGIENDKWVEANLGGGGNGGSGTILEFYDHSNIPTVLQDARTYSIDLSGGTGNYTFKLPTLTPTDSFYVCIDISDIAEGVTYNLTGDGTQTIGAYGKSLTNITDGRTAVKFWVKWDGSGFVYSDTYYPLTPDENEELLDDVSFRSRNLIYNGGRRFYQRADSSSLEPISKYYTSDRFRCEKSGSSTVILMDKIQDSPLPNEIDYCDSYSVVSTSGGAGLYVHYRMESIDSRNLIGKQVTFSLYCKIRFATNMKLKVYTPSGSSNDVWESNLNDYLDNVVAETSFSATTAWERYSITLTVPDDAIKGLALALESDTDVSLVINNNVYTTGWQLELGRVATPFKHYDTYSNELLAVSRYFQKYFYGRYYPLPFQCRCNSSSSSSFGGILPIVVPMRDEVTVSEVGTISNVWKGTSRIAVTSVTISPTVGSVYVGANNLRIGWVAASQGGLVNNDLITPSSYVGDYEIHLESEV